MSVRLRVCFPMCVRVYVCERVENENIVLLRAASPGGEKAHLCT